MVFDVVYITYNSSKWIDNCFLSWLNIDYDLKNINIYVVDNHSSDDTLERLLKFKEKNGECFSSFSVIKEKRNWGFGKANNIGFVKGNSEIVCFFNIDTELYKDTMKNLEQDMEQSNKEVGLWELRQFPYEHPKLYDPLTGETTWCSGAAFAVKRELFKKIHGFDGNIFMYAEDVDLSWRIRSFGYKLKYVPKAVIKHYSYENAGEVKPNQYINSIVNNLLLRYRFGGIKVVLSGHKLVLNCIKNPEVFPNSRKLLLNAYLKHYLKIPYFCNKKCVGESKEFLPQFIGFDYAAIRDGAFYFNDFSEETPLVSIIVRTCGRPAVLRETLCSLQQQTYPNFEVVIVEDGEPVSKNMIEAEFYNMNIIYVASGEKIGRCKAGNLAMKMAKGKYLNFLDDDDLFYADHIEVLVYTLQHTTCRAAYSFAFETPIEIKSKKPYVYEVKHYYGIHKQKFDKLMLCHHNYIPIQAIMFEKSLFEEYGGLDENVDALEDWDLWVRYSLYTDFECVEKTTSIYRVPFDQQINQKRQRELDQALIYMR